MKRFTTVAVLLVLLVLLGGISAQAQRVQLRFQTSVYVEEPHKVALDALKAAYEKLNPDVEIVFYGTGYADFWDRLTTEIISGTEADIIQLYPHQISQYAALRPGDGAFAVLNDKIIGTEFENLIGQAECMYKGNYVGLSSYAWGVTGLFYRKSVLDEAGIDVNEIKTLNEWADVVAELTKDTDGDGRIDQYGFGIVLGNHPFVADEWYRMVARPVSGGIYFSDGEAGPYTPERVNASHPGNVWAAKFWQDLLFEKKVSPTFTPDKKDVREYFWNGSVAFNMDGPWFVGMTREYDEAVLEDTGLIPHLPIEYNGQLHTPTSAFYPLVNVISDNSPHKEEAWEFVKWMASPEAQELVALCGMIPSNPEYSESEAYKEAYPMNSLFVEFLEGYILVNDPAIPELGELTDIMINSAQRMFIQGMDADTVLNDAAEQMKNVFR